MIYNLITIFVIVVFTVIGGNAYLFADCPLRPNTFYGYTNRITLHEQPKPQNCAPDSIGYVLMDRVDTDFSLGILWDVIIKTNVRVQLTNQTLYWRCNSDGTICLSSNLESMPRSGKSGAYIAKYDADNAEGKIYVAEKYWSYEGEQKKKKKK